jgi:hypothetical protein
MLVNQALGIDFIVAMQPPHHCLRIPYGLGLIIALDRTQWKENNILIASAIYQKRALPIFWILLE